MTDPDPHILKSAAAYLREIARRPDAGRRHRKQPKIEALRQYKEEILEANRSGVSVHRIAQFFPERGVDISVPHLVRTITHFIKEKEPARGRSLAGQDRPASQRSAEKPHAPAAYQVSDQASPAVREEEFARQLRIARYLAAGEFAAGPGVGARS